VWLLGWIGGVVPLAGLAAVVLGFVFAFVAMVAGAEIAQMDVDEATESMIEREGEK
jgi:hypothetical protein